ncbi:MAG: MFS transporter [Rhizomicrobium sp.]
MGGLVGVGLSSVMAPGALDAYGWRIAFLLGAITLPFGLWIRRSLPETLHAPDTTIAARRAHAGLDAIRENFRIIALALVVLASGTIGTYVFNYMTTFAQNTLHLPPTIAFLATTIGQVVTVASVLYGGWLSDRIGRRPVMIWSNLVYLVLILPVFFWIVETRSTLALIVGLSSLGIAGALKGGAFFVAVAETLPKRIRGTAFATIYASSIALFGGTTQLVITWLIQVTGNPMAPAWYLVAATLLGQTALMLILESAPAKTSLAPALAR